MEILAVTIITIGIALDICTVSSHCYPCQPDKRNNANKISKLTGKMRISGKI
jgi:hypothetical protein